MNPAPTTPCAPIRVLTADDHPVVRTGVARLVAVHMKKILAKLDADDRVEAVMIALRRGIIDLDR